MPQKNSQAVDLGLAVLSVVNRSGIPLSQGAIADVVGCDKRTIQRVEERALNKVRIRLNNLLREENATL